MKTLYLDCFSGISGDMTVGALLDLGADFEAIKSGIASFDLHGFTLTAERKNKDGIMATQFTVVIEDEDAQPWRSLPAITEIITKGALPEQVKADAIETFTLLGQAEASVHGKPLDKIHFHEVGAIDAIVDIVSAQYAFHLLGVDEVSASALHVGAGTLYCEHGVLPVPAPATALLLQGKPTYGGDVQGELVTPTGAAIIAQRVKRFGGAPAMRVERVGYGSGTKELPDRANVLRAMLGEADAASAAPGMVSVIEANIDDMNPELLPVLVTCLMHNGAKDAFLVPVLGKKGRPAYMITVLCEGQAVDALTKTIFENSTTLGLRIREERRVTLARDWREVQTPWGEVRVKTGTWEGEISNIAPEFEECRQIAQREGIPVRKVYEAALGAAMQLRNGEHGNA